MFQLKSVKSEKLRDYAIIGVCVSIMILLLLTIAFFIIGIASLLVSIWNEDASIGVSSSCGNQTASVFIQANTNLKDVKCVALDKEFFNTSEITLGDLSRNDRDVCTFTLAKNVSRPIRFEVWYSGKVRRAVCNWNQVYPSYNYD